MERRELCPVLVLHPDLAIIWVWTLSSQKALWVILGGLTLMGYMLRQTFRRFGETESSPATYSGRWFSIFLLHFDGFQVPQPSTTGSLPFPPYDRTDSS
jgi:hypothetical protein